MPTYPTLRMEAARFYLVAAFLSACFLCGGASRLDVLSLVFLQPFAVVCAVVILAIPGHVRWADIRVPLFGISALAMIMAVQLLPLPPDLWRQLPGHAPYAEMLATFGVPEVWRPMTLSPDLTLGSLVGLSVPLTALIGVAAVPKARSKDLLLILVIGSIVSVLMGVAQVSSGPHSRLYLYQVTNADSPVGVFANRNHQALLVSMLFTFIFAWILIGYEQRSATAKFWVGISIAACLIPFLLVTGSRAGVALGVFGILFAIFISYLVKPKQVEHWRLPYRTGIAISGFFSALLIGITIFLTRDTTLNRLLFTSFGQEDRINYYPVLSRMSSDFLPFGSGFGTFDPVFRAYEPNEFLHPEYLNHAHNDFFELIITGGLPAALVLVAFAGWVVVRALGSLRRSRSADTLYTLVGVAVVILAAGSSVVDYPLRTPLLSAIFAIACAWIAPGNRPQAAS